MLKPKHIVCVHDFHNNGADAVAAAVAAATYRKQNNPNERQLTQYSCHLRLFFSLLHLVFFLHKLLAFMHRKKERW